MFCLVSVLFFLVGRVGGGENFYKKDAIFV